jgi:uncharacterized protein (TIGR03083 family)
MEPRLDHLLRLAVTVRYDCHNASMATALSLDLHIEAIARAGNGLASHAKRAGLGAIVYTCPGWHVAELVAHQAMVHRWAAANLRGGGGCPDDREILTKESDLFGYYRRGVDEVLEALRTTSDDIEALVFLKDAPAPRRFWARRQAHETTIHAVDAQSAVLGRPPTAQEVDLPMDFAADGIDELVCGFVPRGRSRFETTGPFSIVIRPIDVDRAWTIRVAEKVVSEQGVTIDPDVTFAGTAAQLYLGLWNRGAEIVANGRAELLDEWRRTQRVSW